MPMTLCRTLIAALRISNSVFLKLSIKAPGIALLSLAGVFLSGCLTLEGPPPEMTPLEIQSMQSRDFEQEKEVVFRSVVSVFQDLGYTIKNADLVTGFIQADGLAESDWLGKFLWGSTQTSQTKATAFVEQIGSQTRVRLNFVNLLESSTEYGAQERNETPVLEAQAYQNAFERIDSAIFVRTSTR